MKKKIIWRACAHSCPFALLGGLMLVLGACSPSQPAATQPATEVATAMPSRQTFHAHVTAFGQLAADSRNALSLSLPQAGEVTATEVIAGRRVQRGAVLLQLATDPASRSAYLQAQSALRVARDDLARSERLHAEKLVTNTQLDAARKALADAQAAFDAQVQLGYGQPTVTLKAPADGVVTAFDVQRGQRVAAGTPLIQFTPASALAAQLGVEPGAAADIRTGMPVTIVPVYAAHGSEALHATVAMVGDAVNPQTHLVDLVATLDQPAQLAAGTALSARIDTSSFTAWSIPRDALQNDSQGDFIYQIEQGKARRVDVKVPAPDGSPIGVEGALDPHAPVITLGSYEIADGDAVRATPAARRGTAAQ
ncbi:MAG: efflux RND transporter periplasmic adaptor subunit [Proteobacteria bacterium]|nr:efflux RND transporter periplasmic adaptor subunit [Pseudomonadota bacterium]